MLNQRNTSHRATTPVATAAKQAAKAALLFQYAARCKSPTITSMLSRMGMLALYAQSPALPSHITAAATPKTFDSNATSIVVHHPASFFEFGAYDLDMAARLLCYWRESGKGIPSPRLAVEFTAAYLHPTGRDVDASWLYQLPPGRPQDVKDVGYLKASPV